MTTILLIINMIILIAGIALTLYALVNLNKNNEDNHKTVVAKLDSLSIKLLAMERSISDFKVEQRKQQYTRSPLPEKPTTRTPKKVTINFGGWMDDSGHSHLFYRRSDQMFFRRASDENSYVFAHKRNGIESIEDCIDFLDKEMSKPNGKHYLSPDDYELSFKYDSSLEKNAIDMAKSYQKARR